MAKLKLGWRVRPKATALDVSDAKIHNNIEISPKMQMKNLLSLSQPMLKVPVYKGSRAFPAGAKGRRRFTSLSQNWV